MKKLLTILFSTLVSMPAGYAADGLSFTPTTTKLINFDSPITPKSKPVDVTGKTNTDVNFKDVANGKTNLDKQLSSEFSKTVANNKTPESVNTENSSDSSKKLVQTKIPSDGNENSVASEDSNSNQNNAPVNNDKIAELEANAKAMKDKEQSDKNKLLGAASIGATGVGASQLLQGLSEKSVDTKSENDMKAYLATFKCDYGQGQNVNGGEKEIILPAANFVSLKSEYKTLADDLKNTKNALGMIPGIESETILDSANTGLYDNKSLGKNAGAFVSVSDALTGNADAAAAWDAQKAEAASKIQTGMIAAGAGIVGGAVGNILLNKNSPKESSDEINAKYATLMRNLETNVKNIQPKQEMCSAFNSSGVFPGCKCENEKSIFSSSGFCTVCPGQKIAKDNKCQCPDGTIPTGELGTCGVSLNSSTQPRCDISSENISVDIGTNSCTCINDFSLTPDGKKCECPSDTKTVDENGKCVDTESLKETFSFIAKPSAPKASLNTKNMFEPGSYELTNAAKAEIAKFVADFNSNSDSYCLIAVGYTDTTGTTENNVNISKQQAAAVAAALSDPALKAYLPNDTTFEKYKNYKELNRQNIIVKGLGETECRKENNNERIPDTSCLKVDLISSPGSCQAN